MEQSTKEVLSVLAIALTFMAFMPYVVSVARGRTKPHVFSWVIWGATTGAVFAAQLQGKGGAGAWPIGISAALTILIAVLAYRSKADYSTTGTDWLFLISAMSSLPLWYLTADPLWAVVILTTVDVLGFGPTLRKAYQYPFDEQILFYALFALRNGLSLMALEHYSITTVLFPAATGIACFVLITMIACRRRAMRTIRREV